MKRAAAASAHGEPGAKRRPDSKPASVFKAELAKLRAFVEAHGAVPRRGVGVRAKAKAAVGVYAPGAKKPSPHKLAVPSSERELRLFLDRRLHEHKMLIKVVSKWIKSDGTFRAPWNGQFEELIAFRTTKGRWPEHLLPSGEKTTLSAQEKRLSAWCSKVRHAGNPNLVNSSSKRRHGIKMSSEQVSQLTSLGFNWSFTTQRWEKHYAELVTWLSTHEGAWPKTVWKEGGVAARSKAETAQHSLAQWVSTQRQVFNQTGAKIARAKKKNKANVIAMRMDQQQRLSALGMQWHIQGHTRSKKSGGGGGDGGSDGSSSSSGGGGDGSGSGGSNSSGGSSSGGASSSSGASASAPSSTSTSRPPQWNAGNSTGGTG